MKSDWLGKIGVQLILEDPFWGCLYRQLPRKVDERVKRVSLTYENGRGYSITFHPGQAIEIYDSAFLSLVKHELLHFLLKHPIQRSQARNKALFDLAADLCVDQFVNTYPGRLYIAQFSNFGLLPFQSAQTYYEQLLEMEDEGFPHKIFFLQQCLADRQDTHFKHSWWREAQEETENFDHLVEELIKMRSQHLQFRWPDKLWPLVAENRRRTSTATLNWRDQLHWMVRTSRHTHLLFKKNKRSRRYGTPPGVKIKRKHHLLVAVDTSASVKIEELQLFFQEIRRLFQQGVRIDIVECDSQIKKKYPYRGTFPEMISGRGDTSYVAPIEVLNEEKSYGGLIYFTDGDGPPPFVTPKRPLLWVMSRGDLEQYERFPGKKVVM